MKKIRIDKLTLSVLFLSMLSIVLTSINIYGGSTEPFDKIVDLMIRPLWLMWLIRMINDWRKKQTVLGPVLLGILLFSSTVLHVFGFYTRSFDRLNLYIDFIYYTLQICWLVKGYYEGHEKNKPVL